MVEQRGGSHLVSRRAVLGFLGAAGATVTFGSLVACSSTNNSNRSSAANGILTTAESAGVVVLAQARQALAEGSFGVGGVIIDNASGRIIHEGHNTVIQPLPNGQSGLSGTSFLFDPTNHGERQLVSWYYENASALGLPKPSELTVVTSLDPCAQCAGSLLAAGFNVGVVAFDDPSGINYTFDCTYPDLPPDLRAQAQKSFTYYAIDGVRAQVGASSGPAFVSTSLTKPTADDCTTVFDESRAVVAANRKFPGLEPIEMIDPETLPPTSPIRQALVEASPHAFTLRLADFRRPDSALQTLLSDLVARTPQATNAVAYIDPFGNLLSAFADRFDISPIATAFMNLVQSYSRTRFNLTGNPSTNAEVAKTLTTPKYGTFVFLRALAGDAATTVKDLGIYDLTIEGKAFMPETANWQYYLDPPTGTEAQFLALVAQMKSVTGANPSRVAI
jgi:cytosine deaminase